MGATAKVSEAITLSSKPTDGKGGDRRRGTMISASFGANWGALMGLISGRLGLVLGLQWVMVVALVACNGQERGEVPYKRLREWRSDVTGDGRLKNPRALAVDASGNVYVADVATTASRHSVPAGGFSPRELRRALMASSFHPVS
jgi:hypothetical protein